MAPLDTIYCRMVDGREMTSLSTYLRMQTQDAHDAAEADFTAEVAFRDLAAYAATLRSLQRWYPLVERRLHSRVGQPVEWRRAALLVDDLAELGGSEPSELREDPSLVGIPDTLSLPEAAGWLYVLVGSALGGRVLARLAVAALGPATPISFFDSGHRDVGALWRGLSAAQDAVADAAKDQEKYAQDAANAARLAFASFRRTVRWGGC